MVTLKENLYDTKHEENVYNKSKLALPQHRDKLKSFLDGELIAPTYVRIKPTNICNQDCWFCSYGANAVLPVNIDMDEFRAYIPFPKMKELLVDLSSMGTKSVTFSGGGEPSIYRDKDTKNDFEDVLDITRNVGLDYSIITNGERLEKGIAEKLSHAKWVRVSFSEIDDTMAHFTRGMSGKRFDKEVNNLRSFAELKNKVNPDLELGINYVFYNELVDQVYDAMKFFHDLGADHVKVTPVYGMHEADREKDLYQLKVEHGIEGNERVRENEKVRAARSNKPFTNEDYDNYHAETKDRVLEQLAKAREDFQSESFKIYDTYGVDFESVSRTERPTSRCYIMETVPVVSANSVVYPCHDKTNKAEAEYGSIKDRSFRELWFSDELRRFINNFNPQERCCHHCTYDGRNVEIENMLNSVRDNGGNLDIIDMYMPDSDIHGNFI